MSDSLREQGAKRTPPAKLGPITPIIGSWTNRTFRLNGTNFSKAPYRPERLLGRLTLGANFGVFEVKKLHLGL